MVGQWWCTPLFPGLGRQRQEDLCEFGSSLVYRVSSGKTKAVTQRSPISKSKQTKTRKIRRKVGRKEGRKEGMKERRKKTESPGRRQMTFSRSGDGHVVILGIFLGNEPDSIF